MKIEFVIHHSFISASFYLFYFGSNSIQICLFCVCLHCFLFIHFIILFCLFVLILFCFVCLIWVWHNGYCTWSAVFIFYWQINYLIKLSFILFNTFIQSIKSFKSFDHQQWQQIDFLSFIQMSMTTAKIPIIISILRIDMLDQWIKPKKSEIWKRCFEPRTFCFFIYGLYMNFVFPSVFPQFFWCFLHFCIQLYIPNDFKIK